MDTDPITSFCEVSKVLGGRSFLDPTLMLRFLFSSSHYLHIICTLLYYYYLLAGILFNSLSELSFTAEGAVAWDESNAGFICLEVQLETTIHEYIQFNVV